MKKLTIRDIAAAAGVSCATVSRALSGTSGIGEETRERVRKICKELGYQTNYLPQSGEAAKSGQAGVVVRSLTEPNTAMFVDALQRRFAREGICMILCQSGGSLEAEQEIYDRLYEMNVIGVILMPASADSALSLASRLEKLPTVFLDASMGQLQESYVAADHFLGAQSAVRYLQEQGHRRIFFLHDPHDPVQAERALGYQSACRRLGLDQICMDVNAWLQSPDRADLLRGCSAAITGDCAQAVRVWREATAFGVAVPEKLSLVSFDGMEAAGIGVKLTTFDRTETMAVTAAEILLEQIGAPMDGYSHRMMVPGIQIRDMAED